MQKRVEKKRFFSIFTFYFIQDKLTLGSFILFMCKCMLKYKATKKILVFMTDD